MIAHFRFHLVIASCVVLSACTTTPRLPGEPTEAERPLVERAQAWCKAAGHRAGEPTRAFFTDGCSAWIDGKLYACCVEHDIPYWCGGSAEDRLAADRAFRACAQRASPWQSGLVYYGVRLGGWPWWPTPWRWGYGRAYGSGYADPAGSSGSAPTAADAPLRDN